MNENEIPDKKDNILINIINELKKIISDLKLTKDVNSTINDINNIINNLDIIIKKNINIESDINQYKSEIYENGDKYIGQTKNEKAEGKEYIFLKMVINMRANLKMINLTEKGYIII